MTKRIYIRGNVGDLRNAQIYDADTGMQLSDVAKFRLEADAAGVVQAWLERINNPDVMVNVVPGPPSPYAGQTFHRVLIDADKRTSHGDTIHIAKVEDWIVRDDGRLDRNALGTISMHDAVSDGDVAQAINPRDALEDSADRALTGAIRQAIIDPRLCLLLGPRTGGVMNNTGRTIPAGAAVFAPKQAPFVKPPCPECRGTGLANGFMQPCSKGCKP